MKTGILIFVAMLASVSGWTQISDPSEQADIIKGINKAQKAQVHRDEMTAKGDDYVVSVITTCGVGNLGCSAEEATVGELREAGYQVRVNEDDGYVFVKGADETSGKAEEVGIIRGVRSAKRAQAHRDEMAAKGDDYVVSVYYCKEGCTTEEATLGELRGAGYQVRVNGDDKYVFVKGADEVSDATEKAEIIKRVNKAERAQAHRETMAAEGDHYVVSVYHCGGMGCTTEEATAGELREAGYEVRVDDNDKYVFIRSGEKPQTSQSAQIAVMEETASLKHARAHAKMEGATERIGAISAELGL